MKLLRQIGAVSIGMGAMLAINAQAQNLLSDPDFASGAFVANGSGGWTGFGNSSFSTAYTYGPTTYSMELSGPGGYTVPGTYQYVAATPGASYLLTGYAYVPIALADTSDQGFLQLTFDSSSYANLGTVQTSPGNALASTPVITSTSPTGEWIYTSEIATAPADTAYAEPFTLVLDADAPTTVYFDDLSLTEVPEPTALCLAGLGLVGMLGLRRRKV
ncbi:MAG TPA: PEP-CTERM sorting domain-containing protein [Verrucomicrobiae bacterium]|nr:PEP-CTERM sorting domain-containing protein [Verrucomicrobiae bacterium]